MRVIQPASEFTYPFCYTPSPLIREAAKNLCERIRSSEELSSLFCEGKMLGVLQTADGGIHYAFSGLAGGRAVVDGFVPPIYDLTDPQGYFKTKEREISTDPDPASRRAKSEELQKWLFEQYVVLNARGEGKTISQVFAERGIVPPGGTGDCAGPKLLQYAYRNGLKPVAMGEFWFGRSPLKEIRTSGAFYPSCTGKCGPLLSFMMEGLDVEPNPLDKPFSFETEPKILFEDDSLILVDKPSGMLAVRGKTQKVSLEEWLEEREGAPVYSCHRLDMDTSGLILFAKNARCQAVMHEQFENRDISKTYIARLCPPSAESRKLTAGHKGTISLPLMLDYYDRPRQMVDFESGKKALTQFEVLSVDADGTTLVRFTPLTGRTHQLRVHAAHPSGLGRPIVGDRLYGGQKDDIPGVDTSMLHLRADSLSCRHPESGELLKFSIF